MSETMVEMADMIAAAAGEKKAQDIIILDMEGISPVTDAFIICSANSTTQVQAIADNIEEQLAVKGLNVLHREGYRDAHWVLLDYGICVAHVFINEERNFYNLEQLWGDAKRREYTI
jgi:ribosome-associated protein